MEFVDRAVSMNDIAEIWENERDNAVNANEKQKIGCNKKYIGYLAFESY